VLHLVVKIDNLVSAVVLKASAEVLAASHLFQRPAIGVLAASSSDDPPFEVVVLSSPEGDRVAEVEGVQRTFFLRSRVGGGWLCRLTVSLETSGHPGYAGTVNGLNTITGPVTSDAALTAMPMKSFWVAHFDRAWKDKHKDELASRRFVVVVERFEEVDIACDQVVTKLGKVFSRVDSQLEFARCFCSREERQRCMFTADPFALSHRVNHKRVGICSYITSANDRRRSRRCYGNNTTPR
jgi:hypothetical protein